MKTKQLIILFAFCLFAKSLFAQAKTFNVGVDLYPNYSVYSGEEARYGASYIKKPAITFGVVASYQLNDNVSFESGLKYVNRGHKEEGAQPEFTFEGGYIDDFYYGDSDSKRNQNYNFLSVPLNIRLSLSDDFDKGFYLRFGVSADFFLSGKSKYTYIDNDGEKRYEEEAIDEDIRKTHLNLNYGLGYSFLLPKNLQLSVEPAFEYMFYKMYHKGRDFNYNSAGVKLRFMFL